MMPVRTTRFYDLSGIVKKSRLGRTQEILHPVDITGIIDSAGSRSGVYDAGGRECAPLIYSGTRKFQEDPLWRDLILFYKFYHGENGAGLGASHQTGRTGLVAALIDEWRR
jgi:hypothetical protein